MIVKFSSPFRLMAAMARTVFAKVFGYQVLASVEIWDERLGICMNCAEFHDDTGQCLVCTCFVDAKTSLALEQCPKKKWLRVWKRRTVK